MAKPVRLLARAGRSGLPELGGFGPLRSRHEPDDWNATWNGAPRCRRCRDRRRTHGERGWLLGRMLRRSRRGVHRATPRRGVHRATPRRVVPGICDHLGPRTLAAHSRPQRRPNVPNANRALLGGRCCILPTRRRADVLTPLRVDRCAGLPPRRTMGEHVPLRNGTFCSRAELPPGTRRVPAPPRIGSALDSISLNDPTQLGVAVCMTASRADASSMTSKLG